MQLSDQKRLDQLIREAPAGALRGAIKEALGSRISEPNAPELVRLLTEAVEYVTPERKLERTKRSLAASRRRGK
jgi:hypothetical protein